MPIVVPRSGTRQEYSDVSPGGCARLGEGGEWPLAEVRTTPDRVSDGKRTVLAIGDHCQSCPARRYGNRFPEPRRPNDRQGEREVSGRRALVKLLLRPSRPWAARSREAVAMRTKYGGLSVLCQTLA